MDGSAAKPRLRFDKVAVRVIASLQAAARKTVPNGATVVVTITAPIRLPAKTAVAIEDKIQILLKKKSPGRGVTATICGNHVRIRLLKHKSKRAPKLIGYVHNPETDVGQLFDMARRAVCLNPI